MHENILTYPISIEYARESANKKIIARERRRKNNGIRLLSLENIQNNIKIEKNKYGEELYIVDGDIPVDLELENNKRFLFYSYDQSAFTHGFHKYPAKFFPGYPKNYYQYQYLHNLLLIIMIKGFKK